MVFISNTIITLNARTLLVNLIPTLSGGEKNRSGFEIRDDIENIKYITELIKKIGKRKNVQVWLR
jgi:hypothetical protein